LFELITLLLCIFLTLIFTFALFPNKPYLVFRRFLFFVFLILNTNLITFFVFFVCFFFDKLIFCLLPVAFGAIITMTMVYLRFIARNLCLCKKPLLVQETFAFARKAQGQKGKRAQGADAQKQGTRS